MLSWLLFRRWRWKFQRERRSAANPLSAAPDRLQRRANPPMSALHCALQGACRPFRRVNHDDDKAALADQATPATTGAHGLRRSEEHTSELQSLMRISYAVFCLKKKKKPHNQSYKHTL